MRDTGGRRRAEGSAGRGWWGFIMVSTPRGRAGSARVVSGTIEPIAELPFTRHGTPLTPLQDWLWHGLKRVMDAQGHRYRPDTVEGIRLVVNFADLRDPRPFRRRAQGTFVVTIVEDTSEPDDILRAAYPVLVRALSNLGIYLVPDNGRVIAHFLTMEQGHYVLTLEEGASEEQFFTEVYQRLAPLATSQLVINNEFIPDLPAALWEGDATTREITWAGEQLGKLNLLP
ncbi:MAG: hypothetical protein ACRD1H_03905, partial [Vicinamibacterales bacterium]